MRKLITMVFTLASTLIVFAQNGLKGGDYFLLQNNKTSVSLNTYKNDKINEIKTFAITEKSIYTTDQKAKVVVLDTATNNILLYDIQTSKKTELSIPYDIKPRCLLLNNANLFIGGKRGEVMLVQYNIETEKWFQLEIPEEEWIKRKGIDDLVVNDSLLIAIDNIILPKYVLFYYLEEQGQLPLSHFIKLKSNAAYEGIHQGRITPNYLGLRSTANSGNGGFSEHITIYNSLDLTSSFAVSVWQNNGIYHFFNDFLIIDNKIIIASKRKGLGIFEIEPSYFREVDEYRNKEHNVSASATRIKYKEYKDENILKLQIIPNTTKIILTIEDKDGGIRHEVKEI